MVQRSSVAAQMVELALMPLSVGLSIASTFSSAVREGTPRQDGSAHPTDEQIRAAAAAFRTGLVRGHDVGFQSLLNNNLPDEILLDVARLALEAARRA